MTPESLTGYGLRLPRWRARLVLILFLAAFAALAGRAAYLQAVKTHFLQQKGEARFLRVVEVSAHRGRILDRHGEPLAVSTPVESVWASPEDVPLDENALGRLAAILEMEPRALLARIRENPDRGFVYLKRHLSPEAAARVAALQIEGVFLQREYRRYYPSGEVAAHLIGFTNVDDDGQEGIELAYQDLLKGVPGSRRVIKDRLGRVVEDVQSVREPKPGQDLTLSVDRRIQYLAYRELKQAVEKHRARAGGIVVLDATTGEVLALANVPSYNPNDRAQAKPARVRNRVVTDAFEPGSTLKPFTVAAALASGRYRSATPIDTRPGSLTIGPATVRDAHPHGVLTVAEVVQKSSNVGAAKIALALPAKELWSTLERVGFGTPSGSGYPGEVSGRLRPYQRWRPIEQATMSYGHGISVSLLQLARAYTVFATDGRLLPVSFLKVPAPAAGERVFSPQVAQAVRDMLELAVQPGGTAPAARVLGYRVAGKTGTAHKLVDGRYAPNLYVSSFVGLAPASRPRLVVAVMVDEPRAGEYYGGVVAAPVFARVVEGTLRMLDVPPDAPMDPGLLAPEGLVPVREEV
ncbi:peptidoglycan D,D-transpeptidase FtsI family protein [Pelomicrobium sp.]|jgi:cell division protein FtsI (penicillin-binding protein 3)|uniref:peptidoglycan D,D-transpeptidase FtsI family protein n=1 Tax=Pelomicrobium sp. TaxID=2815319 RepID=UPI002FDD965F